MPQGFPTGMDAGYGTDWDLPSYGFSPASMTEGFQRASGKPFGAPAGAYLWPRGGLTRRLRRERWGCRPEGGKYFLSARKKVPKKARGTATTGKSPLLPILTAGLAMSRAMNLGSFHLLLERARARLFPPSKWAGLFPSAAYRRSSPPPLGWGRRSNSAG